MLILNSTEEQIWSHWYIFLVALFYPLLLLALPFMSAEKRKSTMHTTRYSGTRGGMKVSSFFVVLVLGCLFIFYSVAIYKGWG